MEKNEGKVLERNLEQKVFEDATKAIESGKEDGCSYTCCNYEERI